MGRNISHGSGVFALAVFALTTSLNIAEAEQPHLLIASRPDPALPELQRLERYVGTWTTTMHRKAEAKSYRVEARVDWILGGKFLRSTYEGDGMDGLTLTTYDKQTQRYRRWQYDAAGKVTEFTGTWDKAAQTLRFEHVSPDESYRVVVESQLDAAGRSERFSVVVRDRDGQELDEFSGTSERHAR